jgi:hypothetical protein
LRLPITVSAAWTSVAGLSSEEIRRRQRERWTGSHKPWGEQERGNPHAAFRRSRLPPCQTHHVSTTMARRQDPGGYFVRDATGKRWPTCTRATTRRKRSRRRCSPPTRRGGSPPTSRGCRSCSGRRIGTKLLWTSGQPTVLRKRSGLDLRRGHRA